MTIHTLRIKPLPDMSVMAILLPLAGSDCAEHLALISDGVGVSVLHHETGTMLASLPARHPLVASGASLRLVSAAVDGDSYRALRAHLTIGVEVLVKTKDQEMSEESR